MLVKRFIKQRLRQPGQGFTLVEVLAAILIATLFVGVTMQSMLVAAILKARGREYTEAMGWILDDLEGLKSTAATYEDRQNPTSLTVDPAQYATSITVNSATGYALNDTLRIGSDNTHYKITNVSGNTLTISPGLIVDHPNNATVAKTTRCGTTTNPAMIDTGYADGLRDRIIGGNQTGTSSNVDIPETSSRTGQQFTMRRTLTLANVPPYNMLQINYTVTPTSGVNPGVVATNYTEVIPDDAFSCP